MISMGCPGEDPFLEERVVRYDEWLRKGQISFASRVVPVAASLDARQWVLPSVQASEILQSARAVALQNCECRTHYQRCDRPIEVCFVLNEVADRAVARGEARYVSLDEAVTVLEQASASGLVHMSLYMPDHQVYALCNCCACCCHDLQIVRLYGRLDLMVRSEYVAVTDAGLCTGCGDCVERCAFGARHLEAGRLAYDAGACMGCGLCVTVCPLAATSLEPRPS